MNDEERPEPSVDRPSVWMRWAAPGKYTFSASVIGAVAGAALVNALGASDWFYALGGPLLATIVDVVWRRHVPTSAENRGRSSAGRRSRLAAICLRSPCACLDLRGRTRRCRA